MPSWAVLSTWCIVASVLSNKRAFSHEGGVTDPRRVSKSVRGIRALMDYLVPWLPTGSSSSQYCDGEIPQGARKFLPGQGAAIPVGIPGSLNPAPSSQSAAARPQTDKQNQAQQKQLELEQTDLGEAGRGVRPGVIQALGQAVVMVTASPFTSGPRSQFSEGEAEGGGLGCPRGPVLLQVIETTEEALPGSSVFSKEPHGRPGWGAGVGWLQWAARGWPAWEGGKWLPNQQRGLWKDWKAFPAERICSCVSFLGKT